MSGQRTRPSHDALILVAGVATSLGQNIYADETSYGSRVSITDPAIDREVLAELRQLSVDDLRHVRSIASTLMVLAATALAETGAGDAVQHGRGITQDGVIHSVVINPRTDL